MSSPQQTEGGSSTPALVAWFTQVSEAITSAFLGRGSGDSADRSTISPGLPDDGSMTGSDSAPEKPPLGDPDVSSMGNQEKLDAIRKRLAYLGLTDEEIAERLSTIPEETEDLESQMPDLEENRPSSLHCSANSYGEEEDQSSSSDSEDEIAKFEIFQSHSHNLCSSAVARHHRLSCLLSDCTDGDGLSSSQDPLTFGDQDGESMSSQDTMNGSDPCLHKGPEDPERSLGPVLCGPAPEGIVETEMAQDNEDATDSFSTWSPEDQAAGEELAGAEPSPSIYHPVTSCGDLVVVLDYRAEQQKLLVTVARARGVPDKERSGTEAWQVHLVLLPAKKQRHKTGVGRGPEPHFGDTFRFLQLDPDELGVSALRFRLYAVGKMSREHMMGEGLHHLQGLVGVGETEATVELKPHSYMQSESVSSTQLLSHGGVPELLLGLSYNATTGRLSVEVIKGSHFRNLAISRPPDTYGKLTLLDSTGQEVSRCKTSVRRGQPNPVYKETFVFQVALFQLSDVTLLVSIYSRRSMKRKEMVGWVSLGQSSSGQEEQLHWQDMRESHGQQVCRWHSLLES